METSSVLFSIDLNTGATKKYNVDMLKLDSHTMIVYNEWIYIFGGFQNGTKSNNLFKIEITTMNKAVKIPQTK